MTIKPYQTALLAALTMCACSYGCGDGSQDRRSQDAPPPTKTTSYSDIIKQGGLPYMTPEETLRAYSKAIEEGDTVMGEMLSVESRHIMMPLIWGFLRQEKAGITEEISNVEIWYSPDSSQCMIYYDIDEIDRKTGKVVRNKPDRQDHMIMINGRWKMGSGPDDKLLPKSLQDRWPEYEEEKAAALKEADEMMAKELEQ